MLTSIESTYPWPVPTDPKSVRHFYRHNALQIAARDALGNALCDVYFKFAKFGADGSSFDIEPEELATLVAVKVHESIVEAARIEDHSLVQNEAHELVILRGANNV